MLNCCLNQKCIQHYMDGLPLLRALTSFQKKSLTLLHVIFLAIESALIATELSFVRDDQSNFAVRSLFAALSLLTAVGISLTVIYSKCKGYVVWHCHPILDAHVAQSHMPMNRTNTCQASLIYCICITVNGQLLDKTKLLSSQKWVKWWAKYRAIVCNVTIHVLNNIYAGL